MDSIAQHPILGRTRKSLKHDPARRSSGVKDSHSSSNPDEPKIDSNVIRPEQATTGVHRRHRPYRSSGSENDNNNNGDGLKNINSINSTINLPAQNSGDSRFARSDYAKPHPNIFRDDRETFQSCPTAPTRESQEGLPSGSADSEIQQTSHPTVRWRMVSRRLLPIVIIAVVVLLLPSLLKVLYLNDPTDVPRSLSSAAAKGTEGMHTLVTSVASKFHCKSGETMFNTTEVEVFGNMLIQLDDAFKMQSAQFASWFESEMKRTAVNVKSAVKLSLAKRTVQQLDDLAYVIDDNYRGLKDSLGSSATAAALTEATHGFLSTRLNQSMADSESYVSRVKAGWFDIWPIFSTGPNLAKRKQRTENLKSLLREISLLQGKLTFHLEKHARLLEQLRLIYQRLGSHEYHSGPHSNQLGEDFLDGVEAWLGVERSAYSRRVLRNAADLEETGLVQWRRDDFDTNLSMLQRTVRELEQWLFH